VTKFQTLDTIKNEPSLQGHEALYSAVALDAALKRYGYTDYHVSVYGRTKSHGIRYFNGGDDFHPVVFVVRGNDEFHLQADTICALLGRLESMPVDDHKDMLETYLAYECDVFYEYNEHTSDKFRVFHKLNELCPDAITLLRYIAQEALKRAQMDECQPNKMPGASVKEAMQAFHKLFDATRDNIRAHRARDAKKKAVQGKAECKPLHGPSRDLPKTPTSK